LPLSSLGRGVLRSKLLGGNGVVVLNLPGHTCASATHKQQRYHAYQHCFSSTRHPRKAVLDAHGATMDV
jgi:hypothetical protein